MYNPQLETFIRVADAGSFSKAAEQAFITPTAVLKQINLLEADLGVQLFNRRDCTNLFPCFCSQKGKWNHHISGFRPGTVHILLANSMKV